MSLPIDIGIKTSPQAVDWPTLDAAWARIGTHDVFGSVWMNDHLTDIAHPVHGPSLESLTAMAALVHRVPGKRVGHAVLANTFRHPAVLAKAATVLDHATAGRFVVGLGAGWHEGEHGRSGSRCRPCRSGSTGSNRPCTSCAPCGPTQAARPPGVTRPDPFYPLLEATNEPPPLTPGGPRLFLGGQKRRGIALAAARRATAGSCRRSWRPGRPADLDYFSGRRDAILAALELAGRDPDGFELVAQVQTGSTTDDRRGSLERAREAFRRGATAIILGMPAHLGAAGVDAVAAEVAEPLRQALA